MRFPFFSSSSLAGLEIQPRGLRLIQISKGRRGRTIQSAVSASLSEDVFREGKTSGWSSLETVLARIVRDLELQGVRAAVSLPVSLVRVQTLLLPRGLPEAAIAMEVHAQVQRDFPGMMETLSIDFVKLPAAEAGDMKILFAAVRQDYVNHCLACVNAAGLRLAFVDVDIFALRRALAFARFPVQGDEEAAAVLHMLDASAHLAVFQGRQLLFHSSWNMGVLADFTSRLRHQLQLCRAAAPSAVGSVALCVGDTYLGAARETAQSLGLAACVPDPFARLRTGARAEEELTGRRMDYLTACGLALREVKSW